MSEELKQFCRDWLLAHQPEALKCVYCNEPQITGPTCTAAIMQPCAKSPNQGHAYQITVKGAGEYFEEQVEEYFEFMAQARQQAIAETREEDCKAQCFLCQDATKGVYSLAYLHEGYWVHTNSNRPEDAKAKKYRIPCYASSIRSLTPPPALTHTIGGADEPKECRHGYVRGECLEGCQ